MICRSLDIISTPRRIALTALFAVYCSLFICPVGAQTTFTQRVQTSKTGEGTVTIKQDKAIDELVNGTLTAPGKQSDNGSADDEARKSDEKKDGRTIATESVADSTHVADGRRKVMVGGYRIMGYRVQAFAGGNQRRDRQRAEQVGNTIKASYPDEPVYVHFYSPRWICRVGNYRTYEEAHQMLLNIRKLGISGASIVKGKITVQ